MDWSIQEVARLAGTTSRTLRHYDDIGLLHPSRVAPNGYRHYDDVSLVRLQRILLLRELGLGLEQIGAVLERETSEVEALSAHLAWLQQEQQRVTRQIASVSRTITTLKAEEPLMAQNMFEGFDHTQYKEEVEQRWGSDAYARSDAWWSAMSADEKAAWQAMVSQLSADWTDAAARGIPADSEEAQGLASRHVDWLRSIPVTQAVHGGDLKAYVTGLGDMYVADPRFGKNYGGLTGAEFVRDSLRIYADREL